MKAHDSPDDPDWNSIVDEHSERIFRISYRILGSVHDAEDVSQRVFVEAFRLSSEGPVQSWTGLLVRMATLRSIDLLRGRRDENQFPALSALSESDRVSNHGPVEEAAGRELAAWLRDATANLPEQQGAVFSLAHYEQLGRNEIAAILTISPEAVSTALYKARQSLQSQLKVYSGGTQ